MAIIQSTDQLGDTVEINFLPKRIISLVPSQTEFLFDLGLDEQIVGLTRFCIHPKDKVSTKAIIGGTKNFSIEKIKAIQPDLIIGNKEENYMEGIEELKRQFPVWMSDVYSLNDAYAMMTEVASITGRQNEGEWLVADIKAGFVDFGNLKPVQETGNASCAYFIWRKPYMVAANNTFINSMLKVFGLKNVFEGEERYPEIVPDVLSILKPQFIFLSTEPYSFSEKHFDEFRSFCPVAKVVLVDGEMFSWYGSRLKLAPAYFKQLQKLVTT